MPPYYNNKPHRLSYNCGFGEGVLHYKSINSYKEFPWDLMMVDGVFIIHQYSKESFNYDIICSSSFSIHADFNAMMV